MHSVLGVSPDAAFFAALAAIAAGMFSRALCALLPRDAPRSLDRKVMTVMILGALAAAVATEAAGRILSGAFFAGSPRETASAAGIAGLGLATACAAGFHSFASKWGMTRARAWAATALGFVYGAAMLLIPAARRAFL